MDRDFDGKLSFEEFMGEETPLERLFRSMDIDGDGTVTKEVTVFQPLKLSNVSTIKYFKVLEAISLSLNKKCTTKLHFGVTRPIQI